MKLLHLIGSTDPETGGPIEGVLQSTEVLLGDGHEIEIASLETLEEVAKRHFPIPVHGLGRGMLRYRYNPEFAPWVRRESPRFDAVILHGIWNYSSVGGWRGLRGGPTPYYIFPHGMMDPWFRDEYPAKHMAKQAFWSLFEGRVLRDANAVLFTCEEEKIRARDVFLGHRYRERVVLYGTNGVSGDGARERSLFYTKFPSLAKQPFLLFLSRIHPKKGCDLLIRAFAKCVAEIPRDCQLVIAGPDQVGMVSELRALASDLGVGERIHWPGMMLGDLKWGAFSAAQAMILPSHQENFGIVVAEAMSCGTPVLISNKVNIWREVEAARAGLVEPDTVEGTESLIRRYFAMPVEERMRMALAARQGFLKYFDIRAAARDMINVVQSSQETQASAQTARA